MQNARALRERHWLCARRISDRRHDLGLTQTDVVERLAGVGVHATNRTLSAIEHGQGVDIGRLPEIAVALDCTVTYLLGLTADPGQWEPDDRPVPVQPPGGDFAVADLAGCESWILGPDVPERPIATAVSRRDA
jgi:transcriptional regulator with XRE-family HTH domain